MIDKQKFEELFNKQLIKDISEEQIDIVLTGQYGKALELLRDAEATGLFPALVGPPGVGKTILCRYFAGLRAKEHKNKNFNWLTMDESIKPSHFIGSFDPAITLKKGFVLEAFNPGPLLRAMLEGGTFLANEINRATEYSQNTLLEPLEEASISIPHWGRIKADKDFFFISAMNPEELSGTHRLSEALKDRIKVWIKLSYPDKATELDIIRINLPEHFVIEESELELIYSIINETRKNKIDIEIPASIRAGIAIAKLLARRKTLEKKGELKDKMSINEYLSQVTQNVLFGSIKPKPGTKVKNIIDSIIHKTLGAVGGEKNFMGIFPENPCEFAVDFIRKMRRHREIVQIPFSRQVLSIPKLILSRYYRKGMVTPNDYIEISTVTSFPDNQELAKDIAFQILFPNYKKDIMDSFFNGDDYGDGDLAEELLGTDLQSELDKLQEMIDEIEMTKSIDTDKIQKLEEFLEELNSKRDEDPYKSALQFFNDDSELYKEEISSLEDLIQEAQRRLEQKINSLNPEDLKAGSNLGLNDLIQQKSLREWEKLASKALNNQNIAEDLSNLINSGKLDDLLKSIKFIDETSDNQSIKDQIQNVKNQLKNQLKNLDQLFNAAKTLGEIPKFDLDNILNYSLQQSSFEHNFSLADSLDQYFGTNLREELLKSLDQQSKNSQMNISLESLTKNAFANKSWNNLFNQSLENAINQASNEIIKFEAFKSLSHQIQQLMNSCPNMHCGQKISQKLPDLVSKTLEACETPDQLKNATEFLRKIGLDPDSEDIKRIGKDLKMSEDDIYELLEPNYQLLKKMVEKNIADFQRVSNLMEQLRNQLNRERIKELLGSALANDNRDALGALGHFDLTEALKGAQQIGGKEGQDKVISCLSAGSGENLLRQWFIHRNNLPEQVKIKVKELAKKMLIDLGIYYSRARLGSATTGTIPINVVRPYTIGDDFENIDLEETIFNLLEKGKKLDHINYDDFYVYETAKGLRSFCFELDISGSMTGEKLAYMAICVTMLVYGMRKDEIGVAFFESDTHVLKKLSEKVDMEKLADELLMVSAKGGTRLQSALEWANKQFKENSSSREKLNVLFTDAEVYDIQQANEELRKLRSLNVDFILVSPESSFNLKEAEKMVKIAGGQLLTIKDWNEFPKLMSEIIKSRF